MRAVFRTNLPLNTCYNIDSRNSDLFVFMMWLLIFFVWLVIVVGGIYWFLFRKQSPFSLESVRPPGPREFDQKKRDKVIKQGKMIAVKNACMQHHI